MKATDRAGIGDALPPCDAFLLPCLMPVDVPEHESLGLGAEQRTRGELVVEARHRHTVLADAAEHGAVGNTDGGQALRTGGAMNRRKAAQQVRQVLPTACPAPVAPTAAATAALLTVGTQLNSARAPAGKASKHQPADSIQLPCPVSTRCPMRSATCTGCRPPSRRTSASVPGGSCEYVPCSISTGQWSARRRTCVMSRTAAGACRSRGGRWRRRR